MKNKPILIVTNDVKDAQNLKETLRDEFRNIELSCKEANYVQDFESVKPAVLLLAFNNLESAKTYYLGLYKKSEAINNIPHRTLVLCNADDLKETYQLCKQEYFSSYMLYWPIGYDSMRLFMEVWHALRAEPKLPDASKIAPGGNAAPGTGAGSAAAAQAPRADRPGVLVVDDDPLQGKILGKILAAVDVEVHFATTGVQALEKVQAVKPGLVFMDIHMPDMDGIQATQRIKSTELGKTLSVVMVTGQGNKQAVIDSRAAGADNFIVKPYDRNAILEKVKKYLRVG